MKTNFTLPLIALVAFNLAQFSPQASAQPPLPDSGERPPLAGKREGGKQARLTPEERRILAEAREKALQDPALREARQALGERFGEYREKLHEAMIKADPRSADLLKKMGPPRGEDLLTLTPEELAKRQEIMAKLKENPEVVAAHEKLAAAKTNEERHAARKALREITRKAIMDIDPAMAEKMHQRWRERRGSSEPIVPDGL